MQTTRNSSSFHPPDFHSSLNRLQDILQQILTLNSSKTEFLLTGLKQQLAKIHHPSLNCTHSDRNLGFIFDEHLTFSDQISALSKSIFVNSAAFVLTLIPKQSVLSQLPLCTPNLITVILCTALRSQLRSQLHRLQLIQNSVARAVVRAPRFTHTTLWRACCYFILFLSCLLMETGPYCYYRQSSLHGDVNWALLSSFSVYRLCPCSVCPLVAGVLLFYYIVRLVC